MPQVMVSIVCDGISHLKRSLPRLTPVIRHDKNSELRRLGLWLVHFSVNLTPLLQPVAASCYVDKFAGLAM